MAWKTSLIGGLVLAITAGASASAFPVPTPIIYNVDLTIGTGSVIGTITTDGSFGTLSTADISAFNLMLNGAGGVSYTIDSLTSHVSIVGADVSADATNLSFNFSGADDGYLLFQQSLFSGQHYFCSATQAGTCKQGETVAPESIFDPSAQTVGLSGVQVIGTTAVGAVPLPASFPLFGASILVLAGVAYGKRRSAPLRASA